MNELYHHGVLGQKWGVRRYQNKDGSLTSFGKQKLEKYRLYKEDEKSNGQHFSDKKYRKKYGIDTKGDYDIIKKSSIAQRIANSNEPIDSRHKYVSITDDDNYNYSEMDTMLGADYGKAMSTYTYEITKDAKVANAKTVLNDVINTYGDTKVKSIFSDAKDLGLMSDKIRTQGDKWERKYWEESNTIRKDFLKKEMKKHRSDIIEKYKKQGYDAIVDIEDWYTGVADYPLIMLDPSKSMKLKKEDRYWDGWK